MDLIRPALERGRDIAGIEPAGEEPMNLVEGPFINLAGAEPES